MSIVNEIGEVADEDVPEVGEMIVRGTDSFDVEGGETLAEPGELSVCGTVNFVGVSCRRPRFGGEAEEERAISYAFGDDAIGYLTPS